MRSPWALVANLASAGFWLLLSLTAAAEGNVKVVDGSVQIALSAAQVSALGLATAPLTVAHYQTGHSTHGVVTSVVELLHAQQQYRQRGAELVSIRRQQALHAAQVARLGQLTEAGAALPPGERYDLEVAVTQAAARARELEMAQSMTRETLLMQWGEQLTHMALAPTSHWLQRLIEGKQRLIRVELGEMPASVAIPTLEIVTIDHNTPQKLSLLGGAPVGTRWSGASMWATADTATLNLPIGAQVPVRIQGSTTPGVSVPDSAVIWFAGQRWLYLAVNVREFRRLSVTPLPLSAGLLFLSDGVKAGDTVVVTGAASLLAEEQRVAIPDERD